MEPLDPARILEMGLAFWPSKTLLTAIELGVFTELAKVPLTADQLRQRIGIHERSARDFFDTLVALRMLDRDGDRYSNAADVDAFLDKAKPSYAGGLLEMANTRLNPSWGNLTEGLRTGEPQNEAEADEDFFGVLYSDPARLREFARAMTAVSMGSAVAIASKFPWQNHKTFMDIGTAQGNVPVQVARNFPHITGGGALIVYEAIIDDDRRENAFGLMMSLNMLIATSSGFDFMGADCRGWMAESGFSHSYVEPLTGNESMVVGIK